MVKINLFSALSEVILYYMYNLPVSKVKTDFKRKDLGIPLRICFLSSPTLVHSALSIQHQLLGGGPLSDGGQPGPHSQSYIVRLSTFLTK